jgi:mono/diheme cytochrome c family protein
MKPTTKTMIASGASLAILLGACAGQSGDQGGSNQLSGVVITGTTAAAEVRLRDSSAPPRDRTATVDAEGAFSFDLSGLTPPYLLSAESADEAGNHRLHSAATEGGSVDVNPLTNVAVSVADGGADPVDLFARSSREENTKVATNLAPTLEQIRGVLAPLFERYGVARPAFADDRAAVRAMFRDLRMAVSSGTVLVINRHTGGIVFSAPSNQIASGHVELAQLPAGGTGGVPTSIPGGSAEIPAVGTTAVPAASPAPAAPPAPTAPPATAPSVPATGGAPDGAALYAAKCQSCHGALATSGKRGRTAAQITSAGMTMGLGAAEVQAVADALAGSSSTTPPATTPPPPVVTPPATPAPTPSTGALDGAALYASKCQSCHGPIATSSKRGRTAAQITSANMTMGLGTAEVQAVADALAANTPSTPPAPPPSTGTPSTGTPPSGGLDGAALYAAKCQSCHGSLAATSLRGRTASQITSANMTQGLGAAEVQAVAAALAAPGTGSAPGSGSLDGAALYAGYCQSCHGSLSRSEVRGASASEITSERMTQGLSPAQVQAVAAALGGSSR